MRDLIRFLSGVGFGAFVLVGAFVAVTTDWDNVLEMAAARGLDTTTFAAKASPSADIALQTARLRARETFDVFKTMTEQTGLNRVAAQVELPLQGGGVEYVWMTDCHSNGPADLVCTVEETPSGDAIMAGDSFAVARSVVSDWIVIDGAGNIHGGFALRADLATRTSPERAEFLERLTPLPR